MEEKPEGERDQGQAWVLSLWLLWERNLHKEAVFPGSVAQEASKVNPEQLVKGSPVILMNRGRNMMGQKPD